MVGPDDGRVDHLNLCRFCPACVQGLKHEHPKPGECPTPELSVNARPFAEFLRQITPLRTGSGNPENAVQYQPVIGWRHVDLVRVIQERFGVTCSESVVGNYLVELGFSHISGRPQHPAQDPRVIGMFKKTLPTRLQPM